MKRSAAEFDAVLVPFQNAFDTAVKTAPASYWLGDGVHPTPAGHYLLAQVWLESMGA